jgi:hypothetical protein
MGINSEIKLMVIAIKNLPPSHFAIEIFDLICTAHLPVGQTSPAAKGTP